MKLTIKDFFESKEKLAIHTPTKEQALKLLEAFHEAGEKWIDGESYLDENYWHMWQEDTMYRNDNRLGSIKAKIYDYTILNFEDIIIEEKEEKQMKNYIEEVARMLGVEICEEFDVIYDGNDKCCGSPFHFTSESLIDCEGDDATNEVGYILNKTYKIQKIEKDIIDWSKVKLDTIIEVENDEGCWVLRRFAKYEDGEIYYYTHGISSKQTGVCIKCKNARLLEGEQY